MYKDFYYFKENPFNITSDPDFLFSSHGQTEAFSHLFYGISHRKGIIVITGEVGTGKTTLCKTLLNRLNKKVKTALILNPSFSDLQLLQLILRDLGLTPAAKNKFSLVDTLNQFLLEEASQGHNVVLIIDEAQNLGVRQLEQIRLLSNLETTKEKLLQIILVGQPELLDKLRLHSLRQLNQRIALRYQLSMLNRNEVRDYIRHRIEVATTPEIKPKLKFTDHAVDVIFEHTRGTPRMINVLCDLALLAGFVNETFTIDEQIMHKCVKEVIV